MGIALIAVGLFLAWNFVRAEQDVARIGRWPFTDGKVAATWIGERYYARHLVARYERHVLYEYGVGDVRYSGSRYGYPHSQTEFSRLLAEAGMPAVGSPCLVRYNPANPIESVADLGDFGAREKIEGWGISGLLFATGLAALSGLKKPQASRSRLP